MQTKDPVEVKGLVVVVIERADGRVEVHTTRNIVTDAGDTYYAQVSAAETPTNFHNGSAFDGVLELGTAGNAPGKTSDRSDVTTKVAGSEEAIDATYPQTNDGDADNSGSGVDVVTYRYTYEKGDLNTSNIDRGIITNPTPGASEPVLTYFTFAAAFDVTSDDTLKVFVNHTMNGV